jgi:tetratricopeptide (TPR) repeat protein
MANLGAVPSDNITAQDRPSRFGVLVVVACMALSATGCASMASVQSASTDKSLSEVSEESSAEESRDWLVETVQEAVKQADGALAQGDLERALYFYIAALELGDQSSDTYYRIGLIHKHQGDLAPAALAFEKAVNRDSEKAEAWEALGLIMLSDQQEDRASECLVKATNLDPHRWRAYNGLGIIADLHHYKHLALFYYNIALDIQSGSPAVFNNRGYSHYMAGNLDAAQRDFAMALRLDSEFSRGWRNLALVEVRRENYEQALRNLTRIMSAAAAYNDIGYISMIAGRHDVAEMFFRESIRLSPSYDTTTHENFDLNRELRQLNESDSLEYGREMPVDAVSPANWAFVNGSHAN